MKYLYIFTLFLVSQTINSQTFNGDTGSFAGNATTYFNLNVSGLNPNTITDNFGLEKISLSLNCSQTHYISVILVGPNNVEVVLSHLVTWGSQYSNTVFKDQAPKYMDEDWSGSYNSTYRPDENIGVFNNGQNGNGIWKLKIVNSNSSAGNLSSWNITFSLSPSTAIPFFWSDIPIIKIQTNGQLILDDPKIAASMSIIDNVGSSNFYTDSPTFVSPIGIETRGQSSQMTVKKSYGLTTRDNTGADVDVSIFDMPAEEDWVLISNYYDETLIRNALAYELANQTGHYASRTQFCELFINEQYRGVYMFGEKLKRDNNRIDISKLEPDENSGVDLTGGYILKVDKPHYDQGFNSPHLPANNSNGQYIKFLYEYPEATDITVQQKAYIQDYVVNQFENALFGSDYTNPTTGWRAFADEISFMDYFFINEISKNVDAYRISTYLHKDKNGELVMGPVWDFDLAFHNADYCDAEEYTGWAFNFPCTDEYQPLPWFSRLFEDDAYCHDMHERWVDYRQNIFSDASIFALIDQMKTDLNTPQNRNFMKWNILGRYTWLNPWPYPATYPEQISSLKTWIHNRLLWLDNNLPNPNVIGIEEWDSNETISYSNPIENGKLLIQCKSHPTETVFTLMDYKGNKLYQYEIKIDTDQFEIPIVTQTPGLYLALLQTNTDTHTLKIIVK